MIGTLHGPWNATAFIGALTLRGMIAFFTISGLINRVIFEAYSAACPRTVEGLWPAVGRIGKALTPRECANYFAATGDDTN